MTENYGVLADDFDSITISSYDPTIWSPEEVVGRGQAAYDVEEPTSEEVTKDIIKLVNQAEAQSSTTFL
jgi:hypothetical protein